MSPQFLARMLERVEWEGCGAATAEGKSGVVWGVFLVLCGGDSDQMVGRMHLEFGRGLG